VFGACAFEASSCRAETVGVLGEEVWLVQVGVEFRNLSGELRDQDVKFGGAALVLVAELGLLAERL
jgi:hypothetical protein